MDSEELPLNFIDMVGRMGLLAEVGNHFKQMHKSFREVSDLMEEFENKPESDDVTKRELDRLIAAFQKAASVLQSFRSKYGEVLQ